jgi:outer membrane cobalamin receptor
MFSRYHSCAPLREKFGHTVVFLVSLVVLPIEVFGQNAGPTASPEANQNSGQTLSAVTVVGQLNEARDQIVPYLGATKYSVGQTQIQTQSQGDNAPFNQVILRAPGVSQDSFGQLHVRDEHANLQFRIDDVLIPEGITGFGQEIDTRLVDNVNLITGSLPAQFGFRTTGIIDIHTKEGAALNGGEASFYGGSHETINPSFEFGGVQGQFHYFGVGSYNSNTLGIESPTSSHHPIHDQTKQYKGFGDFSYIIDDSSRITLLLSGTYSDFQIGFLVTVEAARAYTTNLVFPVDATGAQSSDVPASITDNSRKTGLVYGFYLQDEWKIFEPLTVNFGARFDIVDEYAHAYQLSPRINVVLQATKSTTIHAGYARYFTPPPLELVQNSDLAKFVGTTNQAAVSRSSLVKPERAHYFDAGITEQFTRFFSVGVDAYYKEARDLIDEGQFGAALIFSPFNYAHGNQYGVDVTANYAQGGFNAYANFSFQRGTGENITSGEFLFGPDELAFIKNHFVFLDHDQRYTASAGASYNCHGTTVYADMLYGNGLRSGFANTDEVPAYYTFNIGLTHTVNLPQLGKLQLRVDVVNLFDKGYQLRTGSGIGIFAPQFGARRGFFGGVSWFF